MLKQDYRRDASKGQAPNHLHAPLEKVLIISALPFDDSSISRSLFTYFGCFERKSIYQIITTPKNVSPTNVASYFSISEKDLILGKRGVGPETPNEPAQGNAILSIIKKIYVLKNRWNNGRTKPLFTLIRDSLWTKKRISKTGILNWVGQIKPDAVFLHNSDALYPSTLAIYISKTFGIPIVLEISDDYYFNGRLSFSPFYYLYRTIYKRRFRKLVSLSNKIIFISDKMKAAYEPEFHKTGTSIFISSEIDPCEELQETKNVIYAGNLEHGRWKSIVAVANELANIAPDYHLRVFSRTQNKQILRAFSKTPNATFCGFLSHNELIKKIQESSLQLLVEGFSRKDIIDVRYSLSTKVADSMASGIPMLCFAPEETGLFSFFRTNDAAFIASDCSQLSSTLQTALFDKQERMRKLEISKSLLKGKLSYSYNSRLSYDTIISAICDGLSEEKKHVK